DFFGYGCREGDDVVLGRPLDFVDASDLESAALADVAGRLPGDDAGGRHGLGSDRFDAQPGLVTALVAPDATHPRVGVASDHPRSSRSRGINSPLTLPR